MCRPILIAPIGKDYLCHPNGISMLSDGNLVIVDGGNDSVFLTNHEGEIIKKISGSGYGKYSFRQPVCVYADNQGARIFVGDWHNHRVVIYDFKFKYLGEFGAFGAASKEANRNGRLMRYVARLKKAWSNPELIRVHFSEAGVSVKKKDPLVNKVRRILYDVGRIVLDGDWVDLNKPNGIFVKDDFVFVSEKNNRCLSVFSLDKGGVRQINKTYSPDGQKEFGRLGSINGDEFGRLFVCDEHEQKVWVLDLKLSLLSVLAFDDYSCMGFYPFDVCNINRENLAICGGTRVLIVNIKDNKVIYESEALGELHGVVIDKARGIIYICNRSEGRIERLRIV